MVNYQFKQRKADKSISIGENGYANGNEVPLNQIDEEICYILEEPIDKREYSMYFHVIVNCGIFCTGNAQKEGDFDMERFSTFLKERVHTSDNDEDKEIDNKLERVLNIFLLEKYYFVAWR
jgi:hypothetical protein